MVTIIVSIIMLFSSTYGIAQQEKPTEFYEGFKTGITTGFLPFLGQAYIGVAMIGKGLVSLGIGIAGIEKRQNYEQFISGVLVGHVTALSAYIVAIMKIAKAKGFYGGMATVAVPPLAIFVAALILRDESNQVTNECSTLVKA
jgi:hypothetical protein